MKDQGQSRKNLLIWLGSQSPLLKQVRCWTFKKLATACLMSFSKLTPKSNHDLLPGMKWFVASDIAETLNGHLAMIMMYENWDKMWKMNFKPMLIQALWFYLSKEPVCKSFLNHIKKILFFANADFLTEKHFS